MTLKQEAIEIINRNKGDVKDIIDTIDKMILIYSTINLLNNYEQIALDLLTFKMELQIELWKYNEVIKNG